MTDGGTIAIFSAAINNSASFKCNQKITGKTTDGDTKGVKIIVPSKYLIYVWVNLKIILISCEINLMLTCFGKSGLFNDTKTTAFAITDTKLYVLVLTLLTQDNARLLQQLKSGFKKTINWNKSIKSNNKSSKPIFRLLN